MKKVHSSIVGIAASLLATSIHAEFVKPAAPLQSQKSIVGTLPRGATAAENSKTGTALPRASETETFTGGVFSRERGMAVAPVQTIRHRPTLPVLFDPSGKSNQIMVLLDFDDRAFMSADLLPELIASGSALPTDQAAIEDATLKALNTTGSAASRKFGQPIYSDYVLWQTRMTAAQRKALKASAASEVLERYLLLTYDTVDAAKAALIAVSKTRGIRAVEIDQKLKFASVPYNDPYAQWAGNFAISATYQWGLHKMKFVDISGQGAHDVHQGHGWVAVMDGLVANSANLPAELTANVRQHLSTTGVIEPFDTFHGTFVNGLIAAGTNNSTGMAGSCPNCSLILAPGGSVSTGGQSLAGASRSGASVINMSFGAPAPTAVMDAAISVATNFDVAMFAAAGNENLSQPNYPARNVNVLSVGGVQQDSPSGPWPRWTQGASIGANWAGVSGVVGPAKDIVIDPAMICMNFSRSW